MLAEHYTIREMPNRLAYGRGVIPNCTKYADLVVNGGTEKAKYNLYLKSIRTKRGDGK